MELTDFAKQLPDEVWQVFEPILPPVVWCGVGRKPIGNRRCLHALIYVLITGMAWKMLAASFPSYKTIQRRLKRWLEQDCFFTAWEQLATRYERLRGINWDQILLDGSKKPAKKGGEATGPSPVDRSKCGSAIHLVSDAQGMPLGVVITAAGANEGCQTEQLLQVMTVAPPEPEVANAAADPRDLPHARADGGYGNGPTRERARRAGFRMLAPSRGRTRVPGIGRVRCAVERGHAFLAHFGRIARRFDHRLDRYLGWIQLAASLVFIRHEANGFFGPPAKAA